MGRREPLAITDLQHGTGEGPDDGGAVPLRMREKADAGRGREGRRDEELRVVRDAAARRGLRPPVIEDELPLAVAFHVERAGADEPAAVAEHQVLRQPSGLGGDAASFLQRGQPAPLEKG